MHPHESFGKVTATLPPFCLVCIDREMWPIGKHDADRGTKHSRAQRGKEAAHSHCKDTSTAKFGGGVESYSLFSL